MNSSDSILEARRASRERESKQIENLTMNVVGGQFNDASSLLRLIAARIDDGKPLPALTRRVLARALYTAAEDREAAVRALGLHPRHGLPGFGPDMKLRVLLEVAALYENGMSLKGSRKSEGAYAVVSKALNVGCDYVEKTWKEGRRLQKAYEKTSK
jgi:hypothetical protein